MEADLPLDSLDPGPDLNDIGAVAQLIRTVDDSWVQGETVSFDDGLAWCPDLMRCEDGKDSLLHVHLAEELRSYVVARMSIAHSAGFEVHLAAPISALYDAKLLQQLVPLDVQVHVITDAAHVDAKDSLLGAASRIRHTPEVRRDLAAVAWQLCRIDGLSNHVKGRRLEGLLRFLFGQVEDLDVVEHNLRADAEELDLVLQIRSAQGRCWSTLGAPFVIVEAKNWSTKVGQPVVSNLRVKMEGRRGTVRLGVLVGASGFTSDARDQELRFASDDYTISFIGPEQLEAWIEAEDGDAELERIIRHAMLR